jgi:hypothetical protein
MSGLRLSSLMDSGYRPTDDPWRTQHLCCQNDTPDQHAVKTTRMAAVAAVTPGSSVLAPQGRSFRTQRDTDLLTRQLSKNKFISLSTFSRALLAALAIRYWTNTSPT